MVHILVIDDDLAMRHILSAILRDEGYDVRAAASVREAFQLIDEQVPDIICCDLMMPEESGLDFLSLRLSDPRLTNVPVVIISASGEDNMIRRARELGAAEHLAKPMSASRLAETLKKMASKLES